MCPSRTVSAVFSERAESPEVRHLRSCRGVLVRFRGRQGVMNFHLLGGVHVPMRGERWGLLGARLRSGRLFACHWSSQQQYGGYGSCLWQGEQTLRMGRNRCWKGGRLRLQTSL